MGTPERVCESGTRELTVFTAVRRRMCRWQSGYFFRNPLMAKYKYYWRIEPSVKYCACGTSKSSGAGR